MALRDREGQLIQAKTSGRDGMQLSWDAVKEVVTGAAFYRRRHPGTEFAKVCLTNQFFSQQARENAALNGVELLDQTHLADMLARYRVTMLELERIRYTDWPAEANEA